MDIVFIIQRQINHRVWKTTKRADHLLLAMVNSTDHTSIDVEKLETSVRSELEPFHPLSNPHAWLDRVPKRLRQTNEKDYTPLIVSIGPFHHGREEFKAMEMFKRRYLQNFLQRTDTSLGDFLEFIRENEERIRNAYKDFIEFDREEFIKMILVDGAFIIEVFLEFHFFDVSNGGESGDPLYDKPWLIIDVKQDIFLLENQLPFFILEDLFEKADLSLPSKENGEKLSMVELTYEFCKYYWDFFGIIDENLREMENSGALHLVDFLREIIIPSGLKGETRPTTLRTPSVTELRQAGAKLKLSSSKNLFDIKFNKGVLEIPRIKISRWTEILLKNLLAFEQCHCYDSLISDYVILMSYLIDTGKDVDLLVQKGIIEHRLWNNEAVVTLFHNFITGSRLDLDEYYYASLVNNVNRFYRIPLRNWKAHVKHDFLDTAWANAISVVAASILFILTLVQTICSIIPLFQKLK